MSSSNGCGIIPLLVSVPILIASTVIGAKYVDECPIERYVPIFLIVTGAFGLLRCIVSSAWLCCCHADEDANPLDGIIGLFLFAWTIAGSVWVFRIYKDYQSTDATADNYCHETVYQFAFWFLIVADVAAPIFIICVCCIACACGSRGDREEPVFV